MARTRVLVVDDEDVMRDFMVEVLSDCTDEVLAAKDGAEALELLRTLRCDVVVTDIFMPNREGIETCEELRKLYPQTEIVAVSGAAGAGTYFRVLKHLGVRATLFKPFAADELREAVQGALDPSR